MVPVILPFIAGLFAISKPALVVVALFTFMNTWNDFWPLLFILMMTMVHWLWGFIIYQPVYGTMASADGSGNSNINSGSNSVFVRSEIFY